MDAFDLLLQNTASSAGKKLKPKLDPPHVGASILSARAKVMEDLEFNYTNSIHLRTGKVSDSVFRYGRGVEFNGYSSKRLPQPTGKVFH